MPARLRLHHQEDVRRKIQASQLITRLQAHINGKIQLTATQVKGIEILLSKSLPSLQAIDHSGTLTLTHEQQLDRLA